MGLFSFLKKAGNKIFNRGEEPAEVQTADVAANQKKALEDFVFNMNLPIEELNVELAGDTVIAMGVAKSQEDKEKVILALGNIEGIACVDDQIRVLEPKPESVFYEVKSGDSLSKIALAHYDDAMKYPLIFEANRPMLKDPNLIYPGQVLRIPPLD